MEQDDLERVGEEGGDWAEVVFTSSDIPLMGMLVGKSSREDEGSISPSGTIGESACDERESR
jgi:hypothetical protein